MALLAATAKATEKPNVVIIYGDDVGYGKMWGGKGALWNDETMADEFVKLTKKYLAARKKDEPFFLYFSSQDIHVPRAPNRRFHGKSELRARLPWRQIPDLRGRDSRAADHPRAWQDHRRQAVAPLVNQIDFISSFADLLGVELAADQAIDSSSTLDALLGKSEVGQSVMIEEARTLALRRGNWKYIKGGKKKKAAGELYKLDHDIGEQNNVAKDEPDIAAEMQATLQKMIGAESGIRTLE